MSAQEVYKWQDEKGTWNYSHQPRDSGGKKVTGPSPEAQQQGDTERFESITAGNILIEKSVVRFEGRRYLYLDGVVRNIGRSPAQFVKIGARVLAQGGGLLLVENNFASPYYLRENETATFSFMMPDVAMTAYEIELVPDWRGRLTQHKVVVRNPYYSR